MEWGWEAPDYTEPIRAVRMWVLDETKIPMALNATMHWSPGENRAVCYAKRFHDYDAPVSGCGCGFWALNNLDLMVEYVMESVGPSPFPPTPPGNGLLFGVIEQWGKVIPGHHGWRSQYAKVVGFLAPWVFRPRRFVRLPPRILSAAAYTSDMDGAALSIEVEEFRFDQLTYVVRDATELWAVSERFGVPIIASPEEAQLSPTLGRRLP